MCQATGSPGRNVRIGLFPCCILLLTDNFVPLVLHEVRTGLPRCGLLLIANAFEDRHLCQLASCNLAHCLLFHHARFHCSLWHLCLHALHGAFHHWLLHRKGHCESNTKHEAVGIRRKVRACKRTWTSSVRIMLQWLRQQNNLLNCSLQIWFAHHLQCKSNQSGKPTETQRCALSLVWHVLNIPILGHSTFSTADLWPNRFLGSNQMMQPKRIDGLVVNGWIFGCFLWYFFVFWIMLILLLALIKSNQLHIFQPLHQSKKAHQLEKTATSPLPGDVSSGNPHLARPSSAWVEWLSVTPSWTTKAPEDW